MGQRRGGRSGLLDASDGVFETLAGAERQRPSSPSASSTRPPAGCRPCGRHACGPRRGRSFVEAFEPFRCLGRGVVAVQPATRNRRRTVNWWAEGRWTARPEPPDAPSLGTSSRCPAGQDVGTGGSETRSHPSRPLAGSGGGVDRGGTEDDRDGRVGGGGSGLGGVQEPARREAPPHRPSRGGRPGPPPARPARDRCPTTPPPPGRSRPRRTGGGRGRRCR